MSLILSGTDGLSDVDGTAATPAIRGTDANTGIFFPAADTIAFAEGGAEVARFDSSGNFGIGTTSPAQRLHVVGGQIQFNNGSDLYINPGASDVGFYSTGNVPTIFYTNSTERLRLNTSGTVILQGGSTSATGVGITFPATQSASTNANTLDDYEEGTWTPVVKIGTTTQTATASSGFYTKIGRQVTVYAEIYGITKSGTGALTVAGLPFSNTGGLYGLPGDTRWVNINPSGKITALVNASDTTIGLQNMSTTSGYTGPTDDSHITTNYSLYDVSATYFV